MVFIYENFIVYLCSLLSFASSSSRTVFVSSSSQKVGKKSVGGDNDVPGRTRQGSTAATFPIGNSLGSAEKLPSSESSKIFIPDQSEHLDFLKCCDISFSPASHLEYHASEEMRLTNRKSFHLLCAIDDVARRCRMQVKWRCEFAEFLIKKNQIQSRRSHRFPLVHAWKKLLLV